VPAFLKGFLAYCMENGLSPSSSARYSAEVGRYFRARPPDAGKVTADELWGYVGEVGAKNPQSLVLFCAAWPRFRLFAEAHGTAYPAIPTKAERDDQWRQATYGGLEAQLVILAVRVPKAPNVLAGLRWDAVERTESGFSALPAPDGVVIVAPDATEALEAIRAAQPPDSHYVMQTPQGRALSVREVAGLLAWAGAPTQGEVNGLFQGRA
jgi:hypothetical protein